MVVITDFVSMVWFSSSNLVFFLEFENLFYVSFHMTLKIDESCRKVFKQNPNYSGLSWRLRNPRFVRRAVYPARTIEVCNIWEGC